MLVYYTEIFYNFIKETIDHNISFFFTRSYKYCFLHIIIIKLKTNYKFGNVHKTKKKNCNNAYSIILVQR